MIMDPNFIVKVLLSLIVAAALAFAVTPLVKRLAQRVGAMDVPKDERRMHKIPIPRMAASPSSSRSLSRCCALPGSTVSCAASCSVRRSSSCSASLTIS